MEIALVRLWLQIQGAGTVPDYVARAALAYLGRELRAELARSTSDKVLVMHGLRGELVTAAAAKRAKGRRRAGSRLDSTRRGVADRLMALRTTVPFILYGPAGGTWQHVGD